MWMYVDVTGTNVDVTGAHVDVTGTHVDVTGAHVDVTHLMAHEHRPELALGPVLDGVADDLHGVRVPSDEEATEDQTLQLEVHREEHRHLAAIPPGASEHETLMIPDDNNPISDDNNPIPDDNNPIPDDNNPIPDDNNPIPGGWLAAVAHFRSDSLSFFQSFLIIRGTAPCPEGCSLRGSCRVPSPPCRRTTRSWTPPVPPAPKEVRGV
eukprot:948789-Prorocentrum_minimum.AAC.1